MRALPLLAAGSMLLACGERIPEESRVVVQIAEKSFTLGEFEQFIERSTRQDEPFLAGDVLAALFEQFIEEKLLLTAADEAGVRAEPTAVERRLSVLERSPEEPSDSGGRERLARVVATQLRIEALVKAEVLDELSVGDEEIASHFDENRAYYERPETVTVSQILVEDLAEAEAIHAELQKDASRFEALAQQSSQGPEAARGGLMGSFRRGELPPPLESAVFSLRVGRISEVVSTDFGHHIFQLHDKTEAEPLELDAVRDAIRVQLLRERSEQELERYVESLKSRYPVTVHREHLSFAFLGWEDDVTANMNTEDRP